MRHYGVPTRLLDWTESPLVGLYFAVESELSRDGALWVLRPTQLNLASSIAPRNPKYIPNFEDDVLEPYKPTALSSEQITELNPIAVIGPRNTPRMQAQLGTFTVFHRSPTAIENVSSGKHVTKYVIPASTKQEMAKDLSVLRIGRFQLCPELQSLGEALNEV